METTRIEARDAALQLLSRLTFGFAAAALAGVGVLSAVSAATIPGNTTGSSASSQTSSTAQSSTTSSSSATALQPSSGGVTSAQSGSGTVATGASH